jgi:hypothetical protein
MTHAQRNQKILDAIESATKQAMLSKESARKTLIKAGIYTAKGELFPEFGGECRVVQYRLTLNNP